MILIRQPPLGSLIYRLQYDMRCILCGMLLLVTNIITAQDFSGEQARDLHDESCLTCHQSSIYQRIDRRVMSMPQLHTQVLACSVENDTGWFNDEVSAVSDYLNGAYYLFGIK